MEFFYSHDRINCLFLLASLQLCLSSFCIANFVLNFLGSADSVLCGDINYRIQN
jgi:hypothetical protein